MSRVLKFRYYDNFKKRMESFEGMPMMVEELESVNERESMVVTQFTGLKDVDGVEIYEGDLVEHEMEVNGLWEPYEACEVVFDEECGIYCFKWDSPNLLTDYRNLKVVGNCYENSGLSEGAK